MGRIILFAGTSEGRRLAQLLTKYGKDVLVCVATEYGEEVLKDVPPENVRTGRMDAAEMELLMREDEGCTVVDATHPYATAVSENIRNACRASGTEYIRLLRPSVEEEIRGDRDVTIVDSVKAAADFLAEHEGNALLTTGSKELQPFGSVPGAAARFMVRVLPTAESITACREAGFDGKNIIAAQGPFSEDANYLLLKENDISWLVTKESGDQGGFQEKRTAAKRAGAKIILIRRPAEEGGLSFADTVKELCPEAVNEVKTIAPISVSQRKIWLIGAGMGAVPQLTEEALDVIAEADVLIGSSRLIKSLSPFKKPALESYKSEEILPFIHRHPEYHTIAIVLSGDVGFYSGAKKLLAGMQDDKVELICGISSVQYFCAKCRIPWEDVCLVSAHGREGNLAAAIRRHKKVFSLVGSKKALSDAAAQLTDFGYGDLTVRVGVNLSYEDEKIYATTLSALVKNAPSGLTVLIIENPDADNYVVTHGIPDDAFLRAEVPMTKEEIRSVALSKLRLTKDAIVYDIGSGTGSVAVEAARQAENGLVLAIEKKMPAVELISRNARHFGVTNLEVIAGEAPEALCDLPAPTHAFIGGSCGRMAEICEQLRMKNPRVRIVVSAVSLESIGALTNYLNEHAPIHYEVTQITAARSRKLGDYHMMTGLNPVVVAAFDDDERRNEKGELIW